MPKSSWESTASRILLGRLYLSQLLLLVRHVSLRSSNSTLVSSAKRGGGVRSPTPTRRRRDLTLDRLSREVFSIPLSSISPHVSIPSNRSSSRSKLGPLCELALVFLVSRAPFHGALYARYGLRLRRCLLRSLSCRWNSLRSGSRGQTTLSSSSEEIRSQMAVYRRIGSALRWEKRWSSTSISFLQHQNRPRRIGSSSPNRVEALLETVDPCIRAKNVRSRLVRSLVQCACSRSLWQNCSAAIDTWSCRVVHRVDVDGLMDSYFNVLWESIPRWSWSGCTNALSTPIWKERIYPLTIRGRRLLSHAREWFPRSVFLSCSLAWMAFERDLQEVLQLECLYFRVLHHLEHLSNIMNAYHHVLHEKIPGTGSDFLLVPDTIRDKIRTSEGCTLVDALRVNVFYLSVWKNLLFDDICLRFRVLIPRLCRAWRRSISQTPSDFPSSTLCPLLEFIHTCFENQSPSNENKTTWFSIADAEVVCDGIGKFVSDINSLEDRCVAVSSNEIEIYLQRIFEQTPDLSLYLPLSFCLRQQTRNWRSHDRDLRDRFLKPLFSNNDQYASSPFVSRMRFQEHREKDLSRLLAWTKSFSQSLGDQVCMDALLRAMDISPLSSTLDDGNFSSVYRGAVLASSLERQRGDACMYATAAAQGLESEFVFRLHSRLLDLLTVFCSHVDPSFSLEFLASSDGECVHLPGSWSSSELSSPSLFCICSPQNSDLTHLLENVLLIQASIDGRDYFARQIDLSNSSAVFHWRQHASLFLEENRRVLDQPQRSHRLSSSHRRWLTLAYDVLQAFTWSSQFEPAPNRLHSAVLDLSMADMLERDEFSRL